MLLTEIDLLLRALTTHFGGLLGAVALGLTSSLIYGRRLRQNIAIGMSDAIVPIQALLNPEKFRGSLYLDFTRAVLSYADWLGATICRFLKLTPYGYDQIRFGFYHLVISVAVFTTAQAFSPSWVAGWIAAMLVLASDLNEQGAAFTAAGVHGPFHSYVATSVGVLVLALLLHGLALIPGVLIGLAFGYHPVHGVIVGLSGAVFSLLRGDGARLLFYLIGAVAGTLPWLAYLAAKRPWRFQSRGSRDPALWWHMVRVRGYSSIFTGVIWIGRRWYTWAGTAYTHALVLALGALWPYLPGAAGTGWPTPRGDAWLMGVAAIVTSLGLSLTNFILVDVLRQSWAVGFSFTRSAVYPVYLGIGAAGASLATLVEKGNLYQITVALLAGLLVTIVPRRATNNSAVAWLFVALLGAALTGSVVLLIALAVFAFALLGDEVWRLLTRGAKRPEPDYWNQGEAHRTLYAQVPPGPISEGGEDRRKNVRTRLAGLLRLHTLARSHLLVLTAALLALLGLLPEGWPAVPEPILAGRPLLVAGALAFLSVLAWRKARTCRKDGLVEEMYGEALSNAWLDVQSWVRRHTPPGSLFLAEPYLPGFQTFAGRPNLVDFVDMSASYYVPSLTEEVDRRLQSFGFHIRDFNRLDKTYLRRLMREATGRLSAEDLERIAREYGVQYFVLHNEARSWQEVAEARRLYQNSHFCVIRAPEPGTAPTATRRERLKSPSSEP